MRKKMKSADGVLLRWYLIGVICAIITSLGAYGFLEVHMANSSSGFAEEEVLFTVDYSEWDQFRITYCIFGKVYRIEKEQWKPRGFRRLQTVCRIGCSIPNQVRRATAATEGADDPLEEENGKVSAGGCELAPKKKDISYEMSF